MGEVKRQSGKRNADARYRSWLKKTRIIVDGDFVGEWIDDARQRYLDNDEGGLKTLAEVLGVKVVTLQNTMKGYTRPELAMVQRLADLLNRSRELEELLPPPGVEGWGGDTGAMYCGDGHQELMGCGSMFHDHYKDGLCEECHTHAGEEGFEPRDVRWATPNLMMAFA